MAALSIRCLGRFEVSINGIQANEIASEKQKLLLAALALAPGQQASRSKLISVLWGGRGSVQARGSLRHALWAIRKDLGPPGKQVLKSNGQMLSLANATVDVAAFEAAVADGRAMHLEQALALYRGDLLEECDFGGQEGFETFLIERERLRDLAVRAAKKLIECHLEINDPDAAVAAAQRGLSIDPLQEDVHRTLIEIYRNRGQAGLAMKQYQTCCDVLAELGVTPAAETKSLQLSLKATDATAASVPAPPKEPRAISEAPRRAMPTGLLGWAAAAILVVAVSSLAYRESLPGFSDAPKIRPHIAVLPFQDMSIDNQQALYSEGLTADIITDLSKIAGIEVIARDSVRAIGATEVSILEIAETLDVDYVLRGNVRRSRGLVRINVRLIDASTGQHVWAERFDRQVAELFEVQDEVVRQVISVLNVEVSETERAAVTRIPTDNLEAYDFFLRAEHLALDTTGAENRRRKLAAYQKAIELDPAFAAAYAGLARALVDIWRFDMTDLMSSTVAKKEAYQFANDALRLDPLSARALSALALIQLSDGQHGAAIASARNAASLEPGNAAVQADQSLVLALSGQPDAARGVLALAHELNPAMPTDLLITSGIVAFEDGRFDEALTFLERALEQAPNREWTNVIALSAYGHLGKRDAASLTTSRLLDAFPIANLSYYRVARDQMRTPLQTARFIEGLKLAGLPAWPYGERPPDGAPLSGNALATVALGRTWVGVQASGTPFIQENTRAGKFAYRSEMSLRTGTIAVEDDRLCETSDGNIPAGKSCGQLHSTDRLDADYMLLMPESVRYFRLGQ